MQTLTRKEAFAWTFLAQTVYQVIKKMSTRIEQLATSTNKQTTLRKNHTCIQTRHCHLARCTCQYSGKYLASPGVLQLHMCLLVFRQVLSPGLYGWPFVTTSSPAWLRKAMYMCTKGPPLKQAPPDSCPVFTTAKLLSVDRHVPVLFPWPYHKLPRGFVVYSDSFSLVPLNYNNTHTCKVKDKKHTEGLSHLHNISKPPTN